jgi:DNA-binding transcriptional MerR regulator
MKQKITRLNKYKTVKDVKKNIYKMADLERMTGVGREAIRFYFSFGLLPPPSKTSRNMAWYSDTHVELIKRIRSLQRDQFLPLKAIKSILHGHAPYEFNEAQAKLIASLKDELKIMIGDTQAGRATGQALPPISKSHLTQLLELGWISAANEKMTEIDRKIIALWSAFLKADGFCLGDVEPKDFNYVLETVDFMLDKEIEFFREGRLDFTPAGALWLVREGHEIIDRLFALLLRRRINMLAARLARNDFLGTVRPRARTSRSSAKKRQRSRN